MPIDSRFVDSGLMNRRYGFILLLEINLIFSGIEIHTPKEAFLLLILSFNRRKWLSK